MDFDYTPKQKEWMKRIGDFMDAHIYPAEPVYAAQMDEARAKGNPWIVVPVVEELKKPRPRRRACGISFSTKASTAPA